jgi:hypothetical protein
MAENAIKLTEYELATKIKAFSLPHDGVALETIPTYAPAQA